jgi:putative mRNA 3-end processing factor
MPGLVTLKAEGLYCPAGDFYIDPWRAVQRAIITHGHADHARAGSAHYTTLASGSAILRQRLGQSIQVQGLQNAQAISVNGVRVSLHAAGHILGSAQVRMEHQGEVTVVTGDFKRTPDPSCDAFEVVQCDTLITEATFALPIYRWPDPQNVAAEILEWWQAQAQRDRAAVLFCYSLGKAQRILAELRKLMNSTAYLHGAMVPLTEIYREHGVQMLATEPVSAATDEQTEASEPARKRGVKNKRKDWRGALILAPPSAAGSTWMHQFGACSTAFASGWMAVRGARRRQSYDRGFVLSDHADWDGLVQTVRESRAQEVFATHGQSDQLTRYLREQGIKAQALQTEFGAAETQADAG